MRIQDAVKTGTEIREKRRSLGFTLQQMAEATGLSPITIMRLEKGRHGYVHEKTAKSLEIAFAKEGTKIATLPVPEKEDQIVIKDGRVTVLDRESLLYMRNQIDALLNAEAKPKRLMRRSSDRIIVASGDYQ